MPDLVKDICRAATKLDLDINGNPRYYIPVYMFSDAEGRMYRPKFCTKYRGKQYGAGWVFQSYALENDVREAIK
jgi:hypothetical protein